MKRKAELIMYVLFFLSALPAAWMAVHEFFFSISNPSALESRQYLALPVNPTEEWDDRHP
jgi:hypothetical protein